MKGLTDTAKRQLQGTPLQGGDEFCVGVELGTPWPYFVLDLTDAQIEKINEMAEQAEKNSA